MKINKIEVLSKKGNPYFVYKYEDGKFASKALFEEQESKTKPSNKKKKKKKKVTADEQEVIINDNFPKIEERTADLDKTEEWVGESGFYSSVGNKEEVKEGTQVVELGSDYDVDTSYKQEVVELEQSIEEAFNVLQDKVIQEKLKEPIKTPGFFTTWFKKWKW